MFRIHFSAADLLRTRIAPEPDPMWEVVLSLHLLRTRAGELPVGEWRRRTVRSMPHHHLWRLLELSPPLGYFPDFLTPREAPGSVEDQLDRVLSTPRADLYQQLDLLTRPSRSRRGLRLTPWLREIGAGRPAALRTLGELVRQYYDRCLEPYWPQIREVVGADRSEHSSRLTTEGLEVLLDSLHPKVRWRAPFLEVSDLHAPDLHLDGRGLTIQPSYFCHGAPTKLYESGDRPVLVYPAGMARLGLTRSPGRDSSTATLLGATRAEALAATVQDCTTSELARRCRIAVSSASRHATVLREAGLISSGRDGGAVVHRITDLGRRVLDGPAGLPPGYL